MSKSIVARSNAEIVQALAEEVRRIEGRKRPPDEVVISSGSGALDRLLPEGGFRRGTLVEWLAEGRGSGAATLALMAAREAARHGGALVVVDHRRQFYPAAAINLGIDLEKLLIVWPQSDADHAWALDQVLRSRGVAAVWCWPEERDDHTLRRLQLAAESSGVLGLLLRTEKARHEPSWAELRLLVRPIAQPGRRQRNRRLRVELLRCRGGQAGDAVELEIEQRTPRFNEEEHPAGRDKKHETRPVHLASQLAAAKNRRRSRRA